MRKLFGVLFLLSIYISNCIAIWCYRCTSATPGCADKFNWRGIGFLGDPCPEDDDICVKITERRGSTEIITRDCLSAIKLYRADIPPDKYEGCYPAAHDPKLAHYVNNTIKELDIRRDYFKQTEYCYCFLDHRCNSSTKIGVSFALLAVGLLKFLL